MSSFLSTFNTDIDPGLMDDLGDEATFTPKNGTPVSIQGAFSNAYYEAANGGVGVGSSSPAIECLDRDVVNALGGQIAYGSETYDIVDVQPDGTGITLLILRHAQ